MAIDGVDQGYIMADVCKSYRILRSSLKDDYEGRTRRKKIDPLIVLIKDKEEKLVEYPELMMHWRHPITSMQVKSKIAKIIQERYTFQERNPSKILIEAIQNLGTYS